MKITPKFKIVIGACCLLSFTPISSYAASLPSHGPIPFTFYDQDGNGSISKKEFNTAHTEHMGQKTAPAYAKNKGNSFSDFDLNSDGSLTKTELHSAQREQMEKHRAQMQKNKLSKLNKPKFADFDLNGDGHIIENEFYEARTKRRIEKARQGYNMQNIKNAVPFSTLDLNGDQKISPDEFATHLKKYQKSV
ncbi:MAG: hypothetical protein L3J38_01170 [Thiomicrorhabdus sp.]|nr:hypothetical protein [Thiomicrorhabdus sp.]